MPRVNRDLERRLAARRARERRTPRPERRYQFGPSPAVDGGETTTQVEETRTLEKQDGAGRDATKAARALGQTQRPAARPFSEYRAEYAYVLRDLRHIFIVVGVLLVLLIGLSFVLGR